MYFSQNRLQERFNKTFNVNITGYVKSQISKDLYFRGFMDKFRLNNVYLILFYIILHDYPVYSHC